MDLGRSMLPDSEPQTRKLVVFCDSDWELLGSVFDERQFRACIVGALAHEYCNWLRSLGIHDRESRLASGHDIVYFLNHARNSANKTLTLKNK